MLRQSVIAVVTLGAIFCLCVSLVDGKEEKGKSWKQFGDKKWTHDWLNYGAWVLALGFVVQNVVTLLARINAKPRETGTALASQINTLSDSVETLRNISAKYESKKVEELSATKTSNPDVQQLLSVIESLHLSTKSILGIFNVEVHEDESEISSASEKSDLSGYVPDSREKHTVHMKGSKDLIRSRRKAATSRRNKKFMQDEFSPASSEGEEEEGTGPVANENEDAAATPESPTPVVQDFPLSAVRKGKSRSQSKGRGGRRPRRRSLKNSRSKLPLLEDEEEEGQGKDEDAAPQNENQDTDPTSSSHGEEEEAGGNRGVCEGFKLDDLKAALAGLDGVEGKKKDQREEEMGDNDELADLKASLARLDSFESTKGKKKEAAFDVTNLKGALAGLDAYAPKDSSSSSSDTEDTEEEEEEAKKPNEGKSRGSGVPDDLKAALGDLGGLDFGDKWGTGKKPSKDSDSHKGSDEDSHHDESSGGGEEKSKDKEEQHEENDGDTDDKHQSEGSGEEKDKDAVKKALAELGADWLDVLSGAGANVGEAEKEVGEKGEPSRQRGEHEVLRDWASKEDTNPKGLRRAKKTSVPFGSKRGSGRHLAPGMEDAHTVEYPFLGSTESALFVVLDGHVGQEAALAAKRLLPQEFAQQWQNHQSAARKEDDTINAADVFFTTFKNVDEQMKEFDCVGCTATAVFVWMHSGKRYLQVANVGDSAAFLYRDGQAVKLTVDHKVSSPEERARMLAEGADIPEGATRINGLAVSRALGDHLVKENNMGMSAIPHVSECYTLTDQDAMLIVASDGLWDVIPGQRAIELVGNLSTADKMASTLMKNALGDSHCNDNVTVIVARL